MMFLFRLLTLVGALVLAGLVLYGFVLLINRGGQWLSENMGQEVKDFFSYIGSKLPKRKKKKKSN